MEQFKRGSHQNPEARCDESRGIPGGGTDHEAAPTPQHPGPVRRLYQSGADTHRDGVHVQRSPAGPAAERRGEDAQAQRPHICGDTGIVIVIIIENYERVRLALLHGVVI